MRARTRTPIDSSCLVLQPCNPACLLLIAMLSHCRPSRATANASKYTTMARRGRGAAWARRGMGLGAARRGRGAAWPRCGRGRGAVWAWRGHGVGVGAAWWGSCGAASLLARRGGPPGAARARLRRVGVWAALPARHGRGCGAAGCSGRDSDL